MVLSNKKLKQKLRETLAVSLISVVAGADGGDSVNPSSESRPQSLKVLLGSASHQGPRLSKREKRRKLITSADSNEKKNENASQSPGEIKKDKKKRKRDEEEGIEKNVVNGSGENNENAKKLKKKNKKKKKKKKNKNKKTNDCEEEKEKEKEKEKEEEGGEVGNEVEGFEGSNYNFCSDMTENVSTKVYVGGIPYYSTEDDICSFFESCGTITEVDCMKFPESGKFRGIAMLSFKTEAAAKRALAMDGADMGGLFLKIQPYKLTRSYKPVDFSPGIVEGYNRIYLGNLSWDVTEEDLRKLFSNCKIASIRFGMDKETQEFRGYAHVDFTDNASLKSALKLDQEMIHGRPVKIRCAVPKKGTQRGEGTESEAAAPVTKEAIITNEAIVKEADNGLAAVSGKIRRRTCYECGEKGHLSSNCPNKKVADSNAS